MAYDDGYYFGQCKLVFKSTDGSSNTVTVKNSAGASVGSVSLSSTEGSLTVPGRDEYTVTYGTWTGKVQCGYGECIKVMLADGYEPIIQKDFDDLTDKLTATKNGTEIPFEFVYDSTSGKFGYKAGADTVVPFLSTMKMLTNTSTSEVKADKAYAHAFAVAVNNGGGGSTTYSVSTKITKNGTEVTPTYKPSPIATTGFAYSYVVCDLGALSKDDVIKRVTTWSPSTPANAHYGGQLNVFVIE